MNSSAPASKLPVLVLLTACALFSQGTSPTEGTNPRIATPVNALRSPDVHPDRTVTLRLRASQATAVDVVGEINMGSGPRHMTKGEDGVWTTTVGPLPPEIWSYNFRVQGIEIPDPSNASRAAGKIIVCPTTSIEKVFYNEQERLL